MNGTCKFCNKPILWITLEEEPVKGQRKPVDPEPIFALGRDEMGAEIFFTPEGEFFRGEETETDTEDAEVVFVPHRCLEWGVVR